MGTYCELLVADYPVYSEKSQASPVIMTMFRETDKRIFTRPTTHRNMIQWGHAEWDPEEIETAVEYTASVRQVKDRLHVMGYNMERVEREFKDAQTAYVSEIREMFESSPRTSDDEEALFTRAIA